MSGLLNPSDVTADDDARGLTNYCIMAIQVTSPSSAGDCIVGLCSVPNPSKTMRSPQLLWVDIG